MAKIICTQAEYEKLSTVLADNPQFLADVSIVYDISKDPTIYMINPATEKEQFLSLLESCRIEHEVTDGGIILDDIALEGDGYLFIKFYEDGKFQEFIHYPG